MYDRGTTAVLIVATVCATVLKAVAFLMVVSRLSP